MTINWDAPIEIRDFRNSSWFWINKLVWNDSRLSASDKVIYGTFAFFANQNQIAWPALKTLASFSDISERQVYRSVRTLEKYGYLFIKRHRGRSKRNEYQLLKIKPDMIAPFIKNTAYLAGKGAKKKVTNVSENNNNINKNKEQYNTSDIKRSADFSFKKKCPNVLEGHKGCINFIDSLARRWDGKFPNYGKQINAFHKLLMAEYSLEEINDKVGEMEKDRFWSSRGFDLMNVANEMGKGGYRG